MSWIRSNSSLADVGSHWNRTATSVTSTAITTPIATSWTIPLRTGAEPTSSASRRGAEPNHRAPWCTRLELARPRRPSGPKPCSLPRGARPPSRGASHILNTSIVWQQGFSAAYEQSRDTQRLDDGRHRRGGLAPAAPSSRDRGSDVRTAPGAFAGCDGRSAAADARACGSDVRHHRNTRAPRGRVRHPGAHRRGRPDRDPVSAAGAPSHYYESIATRGRPPARPSP